MSVVKATDTCTLAVGVDVQKVDTWYAQTASTASAPAKPTTATPSGWQTTEYAFDASKAVWACQKTTLTDGTFYWGEVSKSSSYEGAVVSYNEAQAAKQTATSYIFKSTGHDAWVCDEDAGPNISTGEAYGPDAAKPTTGWRIGSVFQLVRNGIDWFKLWLEESTNKIKLRLGREDSGHVVLDDSGMEVFDYDSSAKSVALFGKNGARIGKAYDAQATDNESHLELDRNSMRLVNEDNEAYFHAGDARGEKQYIDVPDDGWHDDRSSNRAAYMLDGVCWYEDTLTAASGGNEGFPLYPPIDASLQIGMTAKLNGDELSSGDYTVSPRIITIGGVDYAVNMVRVTGESVAVGDVLSFTWPVSSADFPMYMTFGSRVGGIGYGSSVMGENCRASGRFSHAEGSMLGYDEVGWDDRGPIASGMGSHAEGIATIASAVGAHSEGSVAKWRPSGSVSSAFKPVTASGEASHAEGAGTEASGYAAHAQNKGTIAAYDSQTAIGAWNDNQSGNAFEIGNGTDDDNRSNALAVEWNGNVRIAGDVKNMSGNAKYLPLSGGTVTGNITTKSSANTCFMAQHDYLDAKQANNGITETRWPTGAQVKDKNGLPIANFCTSVYTSGVVGASIYAYNYNTSGTQVGSGHINIKVDKSGNVTYDVTTPQAFRNAIGIGAYGALTGMSADVDLSGTAANSAKKIPFTSFTGAYCSASSGGIKVAQAGVYMIWATPYFTTGITQNDLIHALIYKNSSAIYDHHQRIGTYEQVNVGPIIQTLAANDTIYVYAYNQTAARGKVGNVWNGGLFIKQIA